jgi:hypothetical protein
MLYNYKIYMDCENQNNNIDVIKKIFFSRFLFIIIIFFMKSINPWIKIILLLSIDFVKNIPFLFLCKDKLPVFSGDNDKLSLFYQYYDKILDSITYIICYIILLQYKLLSPNIQNILLFILFYRIIGVTLYLTKNNRNYLFYFVDLFKEILLLLFYFYNNLISFNTTFILFIFILIIKLYFEYQFHILKKGLKEFLQLKE